MKSNKIINLLIGAFIVLVAACEPIEDRDVLTNSFDPDKIELKVVQSTPGGNNLSLQMLTPGVTGYWDYVIDRAFTDRVDVVFPIPGLNTFTYYVSTAYMPTGDPSNVQYIAKTIDVQIDVLDHALPPAYYALVGENLEGKTWVFDGVPFDNTVWWAMVAPYNWQELWWNAAGECCPPTDAAGRMVFDLDGGANYTYYSGPDADPVTGSKWAFNADFTRLTITGPANILGSQEGGGNSGRFEIKVLTADKMVLYVPDAAWATGWLWKFKALE
jgi:hypothetical protein